MAQNIFRLSVRTVGFKDRRDQYVLHINCPCNLKKSLVGEYSSLGEANAAVPTWCTGSLAFRHCPKNQELVTEAPTPKKTRKMHAKTRFLAEVTELVLSAPTDDSLGLLYVSTGHTASVSREEGRYTRLRVQNPDGNFFELRCEFTVANAKKAVLQIWELMQTMGL